MADGSAMRRTLTVAAAFGVGGALALALYFGSEFQRTRLVTIAPHHPVWIEAKWPFLMDQWGEGKAFQCKAADCGIEINLYIRPKIGFCSSSTGVADDNELERLSDFDFMNGPPVALGEGREINVAWMKGRLRAYSITGPTRQHASAISIAYNNDSDALVATVILNDAQPSAVEPAVIEFLNGRTMLHWVRVALGL
jgi:hypothetical protein